MDSREVTVRAKSSNSTCFLVGKFLICTAPCKEGSVHFCKRKKNSNGEHNVTCHNAGLQENMEWFSTVLTCASKSMKFFGLHEY
uniref:C2H2-type domain-containing protein n=1 Tax=Steinernema glaseri TaxID=37863 RepID=A0A1I7ZMA5_9BILA